MSNSLFRSFPVTQSELQDAHEQYERLMEFYVREPLRASMWRHECALIDQYNAAGIIPPIVKPSFEDWKKL